jgi:uncharacterized protein YndB with AHSA1/START domain
MTNRKTITLERTYKASIEDVWELWTTRDGIESWWGPEGFAVKVRKLDLRPGGELLYTMTAVGTPQIEFMKNAGMPLSQDTGLTYVEIVPSRRLEYRNLVDFVPGVKPYENGMVVELHESPQGVRVVLTIEAMHDEEWTKRMVMGWEMELGKLGRVLESR